ncbi:hypothetical protein CPB86DRAFT_866024 [Serendipita vermifera]|nr:hypothetical protein CPB86DRAFT_866024 [Serendipita vermifera]
MSLENQEINLLCWAFGTDIRDAAFHIRFPMNRHVSFLRKKIKKKMGLHYLPHSDGSVTLWKVSLNVEKLSKETAKDLDALKGHSPTELSGGDLVSYYWPSPVLPSSQVQILVCTETRCDIQLIMPSAPIWESEMQRVVLESIPKIQGHIQRYLKEDIQLPIWEPECGPAEVKEHISSLRIPKLLTESHFPSPLLHGLSEKSYDSGPCIDELFDSGAGKTRLLLEGLCRSWGFYFTARTRPDEVGSQDIEKVFEEMEKFRQLARLPGDDGSYAKLVDNPEIVKRRFLLPLYVRNLIFRLYLQCAKEITGQLTEEHKKKWLLLQIAPEIFMGNDILLQYTWWFGRASSFYLHRMIYQEEYKIEDILDECCPSIFCVLDGAQFLANTDYDYFEPGSTYISPRPLLREFIHHWPEVFPCLIVSGTVMSIRDTQRMINFSVANPPNEKFTLIDIGAFDTLEYQQAYLKKYLPSTQLSDETRQLLADRMKNWLHGW